VKVLEGVATDVNTGAVQFSIAPSGALAFIPGGSYTSWNLVWADRQGNEARTAMPPAPYSEAALSPDGTRVALVGGQGGVSDLWVADLERASVTRLTFGEYVVRPVWSPDGSRIAYGARPQERGSRWQVAWKPADGSQPAEVLVDGERMHRPSGFSPDGRLLLFDVLEPRALQRDIWMLPLAPPRQPAPLVAGPFLKEQAVVSPDGRFVAYVSDESGQLGVYARPFPAGPGRFQVSTGYGTEPRWSRDGRELFYRSDDGLWRVPIDTRRGFVAGRPELLFDRVARATSIASYAPSPDGRRFFTFRAPAAAASRRAVALDLGFADRLAAGRP
jgi:Tol biopolymer transport system component